MPISNFLSAQQTNGAQYDSEEDLLILIDFQNVYLPGKPWACPTMGQAIINTLCIIQSSDCPDYVLTKYMAPVKPTGRWQQYNEEYAEINADQFLCDFPDTLKPVINDKNVIIKDTYSSLKSEVLRSALKKKKRVVLTGVVAECCVLATMMEAIDLGLEVVYLWDCISGFTTENEQIIRTLAESFSPIHTRVMSSVEYLQLVSANHYR